MKKKVLNLVDINTVFSTRKSANFVFDCLNKGDYNTLSFRKVESASRSFLDELFVLSQKNNTEIERVPKKIVPLLYIIKKSHKDNKLYAPKIKAKISKAIFA